MAQRRRKKKRKINWLAVILVLIGTAASIAIIFSQVNKNLNTNKNTEPADKTESMMAGAAAGAVIVPDGLHAIDDMRVNEYFGQTGFYRVLPREKDGSGNICYTDIATGQEIILCSQLNCRHDNESCTSWIPTDQAVDRAIPVGNKLVLLRGGNPRFAEILGDAAVACVEVMNPDGTDRKVIHTFAPSENVPTLPRAGLARDAENLYFTIESSLAGVRTLYAANVNTMQVTPVAQLAEEEEKIIGGCGRELILEYTPGSFNLETPADELVKKVIRLNLDTAQTTPVLDHPFTDIGTCSGGRYFLLGKDHMVRTFDLMTGEKLSEVPVELSEYFDWEDMNCNGFFDGRLVVNSSSAQEYDESIENFKEFYAYGIDPATGEAINLEWHYNDQYLFDDATHCRIAAETENSFVVVKDIKGIVVTQPSLENKMFDGLRTVPVFGLIPKADYWAGTGEITAVIDAVNE